MTSRYEFRVDGRLTDQARAACCDMRIEEMPAGVTCCGRVIDESHLLGIMAQCRTLGLIVVPAHRTAPAGAETAPAADAGPRPRTGTSTGPAGRPGKGAGGAGVV